MSRKLAVITGAAAFTGQSIIMDGGLTA